MIDILIPVLGRPANAAPLVRNILEVTETPVRIMFLTSRGDHAQHTACADAMREAGPKIVTIAHTDKPAGAADYGMKINLGFRLTARHPDSEWVFNASDDLRFEPRWDTTALKVAGSRYHVVGTNDMANAQVKRGQFGTHCLIRRRYITEQGGTADNYPGDVLWEGYDHNFVDRELCHLAQHRKVYAFARHSIVRHYHPLWRTAIWDSTYKKGLKNFREDQRLFLSRAHLWGYTGLSAPERKMAA